MLPLLLFILAFMSIIIALFVSRRLSPIPYFPSNKKDINGIVQSLQLANNQVVYDLGAGDGVVIFSAASDAFSKKLDTLFVAVEINPILLMVMWFRRLSHPNRKNIQVLYGDIFSLRYTIRATRYTFFTYISPWFLEKVYENCRIQIKTLPAGRQDFRFVSYFYPVPKLKSSRTIKGVHNTYIYNV